MCGITVAVALAGRSSYNNAKDAATDDLDASGDGKKRKLTNGLSSQLDQQLTNLENQLVSSLDAINHRGPDAQGTWISPDGNIGLGSCRLAINGLGPGGDQPFSNKDGTIHAVVNGELYDHHQIREEMINRTGYHFQGQSDSEIVVALYEYYGVSFLSRLRGEFALCIHDSKKQRLLAARDRSGIKPLFWTIHHGRLLLASEAKALLPFGWRPEWDVRSIIDRGWLTEERTIFKGLRKIRPGHYITCLSLEHISEGQYWDHDYPDKTRTEEEMIEGVRAKMLDAVRVRLQADVPVGIHLSGGIDSAVVAGMAKHLLDKGEVKLGSSGSHHLRCFSIAFDKGSGFDESVIAQNTADFLGVDIQKTHMHEANIAANFEEAVWFDEQPHDELGFEYLRIPDFGWPANDLSEPTRFEKGQEAEKVKAERFKTWTGHNGATVPPQYSSDIPAFAYAMAMPHMALSRWTSCFGNLSPQITMIENIDERIRHLMRTKWHPLHGAQYVWNKTALPNLLLTNLGDRTEMSHSVEGRLPFLDHHLMEYVNNLPPSMKIRYDPETDILTEKWILRQASRPFITEELYTRKKHPYSAPSIYPLGGPMHKLMSKLITEENVEALGFVDWSRTKDLVERAFSTQDQVALRSAFGIAQWVVLGQRFGIPKAEKPAW
ncbi:MAG: hypothetical protein Q9181_006926 [Wetmoreana brouardii]